MQNFLRPITRERTRSPHSEPAIGRPPEWWREQIKVLFFLAKVVLRTVWEDKFHDLGIIHRHLCDFLDPNITPGRRKFISIFRGCYKTTILLAYIIWWFIRSVEENKPVSICYNTATRENAENLMQDFRQAVRECKILRDSYSWWPKSDAEYRANTKFKVEFKHFKFHVASLDTRQVSRHYTIIINDDLVNDDNAYSEAERERVKRKWKLQKSILTKYTKKGIGIEIDVGTPYHSQDLMAHIIKNVRKYDKFIIPYKLRSDTGEDFLTFPEVYTWEDFEEIREDQGASIFSTQYELNVIEESDRICQENWIRYFSTPADRYNRYLVIDPAGTEQKRNDPSAFIVADVDELGHILVVYAGQFWVSPYKMLRFGEQLAETYHTDENYIEADKYTTSIADTVEHLAPKFNFSLVKNEGRPKEKRIMRLKQYFETGRILLAQGLKDLEDQLLSYPDSPHDDLLDALAYVLDVMVIPSKKFVRVEEPRGPLSFEEEMQTHLRRIEELRHGRGEMDAYF